MSSSWLKTSFALVQFYSFKDLSRKNPIKSRFLLRILKQRKKFVKQALFPKIMERDKKRNRYVYWVRRRLTRVFASRQPAASKCPVLYKRRHRETVWQAITHVRLHLKLYKKPSPWERVVWCSCPKTVVYGVSEWRTILDSNLPIYVWPGHVSRTGDTVKCYYDECVPPARRMGVYMGQGGTCWKPVRDGVFTTGKTSRVLPEILAICRLVFSDSS